MRDVLRAANTRSNAELVCEHRGSSLQLGCPRSAQVTIGLNHWGFVPGLNGLHGACPLMGRPCNHVVLLREPISRLVSEYNYFCLDCSEGGKLCECNACRDAPSRGGCEECEARHHSHFADGKLVEWSFVCPHMGFVDWARHVANQYTWRFGRPWTNGTSLLSWRGYYSAYMQGFAGLLPPLTDDDVNTAFEALSAPDMQILWTEELDDKGWPWLLSQFEGTPLGNALQQELASRSGSAHRNSNPHTFTPTAEQVKQARHVLNFDIQLYTRLRALR